MPFRITMRNVLGLSSSHTWLLIAALDTHNTKVWFFFLLLQWKKERTLQAFQTIENVTFYFFFPQLPFLFFSQDLLHSLLSENNSWKFS